MQTNSDTRAEPGSTNGAPSLALQKPGSTNGAPSLALQKPGIADDRPSPNPQKSTRQEPTREEPGDATIGPATGPSASEPLPHDGHGDGLSQQEAADCLARLDIQGISMDVSRGALIQGRAAYDQAAQDHGFGKPWVIDALTANFRNTHEQLVRPHYQSPQGLLRHPAHIVEQAARDGWTNLSHFVAKAQAQAPSAREQRALEALERSQKTRLTWLRRGADLETELSGIDQEFDMFADTLSPDVKAEQIGAAKQQAARAVLNAALVQERFDKATQLLEDENIVKHLDDGQIAAYGELIKLKANTAQEQNDLIEKLDAQNLATETDHRIKRSAEKVRLGEPVPDIDDLQAELLAQDPDGAEARWQPVKEATAYWNTVLSVREVGLDETENRIAVFNNRLNDETLTDPERHQITREKAFLVEAFVAIAALEKTDIIAYQNIDPGMRAESRQLQEFILSGKTISAEHLNRFGGFIAQSRAFHQNHGRQYISFLNRPNAKALEQQLFTQLHHGPPGSHAQTMRQFVERLGPLAPAVIAQIRPITSEENAYLLKWALKAQSDPAAERTFSVGASVVLQPPVDTSDWNPTLVDKVRVAVGRETSQNTRADRDSPAAIAEARVVSAIVHDLTTRDLQKMIDQRILITDSVIADLAEQHANEIINQHYDYVTLKGEKIRVQKGAGKLFTKDRDIFADTVNIMKAQILTQEGVQGTKIETFQDRLPPRDGVRDFLEGATLRKLPDETGVGLYTEDGRLYVSADGKFTMFTWDEFILLLEHGKRLFFESRR